MPITQLNRSLQLKNETSKDSSLPKDKASQDEVGSGVVYIKIWRYVIYCYECTRCR